MKNVPDPYARDGPRRNETPTPETIEVGLRFRHGRQQAGLTQRQVEDRSGISQSEISRLERGKTPGMSAYRVFAIALALGRRFPFGTCPHPHRCAYSAEAMASHRSTRPGVINMSDPDYDTDDNPDFDGAGGLTLADLMPLADSNTDGETAADDGLDDPEPDGASRIESGGLMPRADFRWRSDGWWDGPQKE